MTSMKKRLIIFLVSLGVLFILCITTFLQHLTSENCIVVGSKNDTEGNILSEIIAQLIEVNLDVKVKREFFLEGTFICFNALKTQQIDLYVEYTGTAYSAILKKSVQGKTKEKIREELKQVFDEKYALTWLSPLGFENSYVLLMQPEVSQKLEIETLSDLSKALKIGKNLNVAFDPEFFARQEIEILQQEYGFTFSSLQLIEHALLYMTLKHSVVDVINGYETDGESEGLVVLKDDGDHLPSYEAIPLIRKQLLQKIPDLEPLLKKLDGKISSEHMRQMNYAVEKKGESIYDVAYTFLCHQSLIN